MTYRVQALFRRRERLHSEMLAAAETSGRVPAEMIETLREINEELMDLGAIPQFPH